MFKNIVPASILLSTAISQCCAQGTFIVTSRPGCSIEARAYFSARSGNNSRFDVRLVEPVNSKDNWDFTVDSEGEMSPVHRGQVNGYYSSVPYGASTTKIVKVTLYKYETMEERVTFHDLDVAPLPDNADTKSGITPRFLVLKAPISETAPSGITLTLPVQNVKSFEDMFPVFDGNPNALFIYVNTTPDQLDAVVPKSPLYQKYGKPLRIQLDCDKPNLMVFYQADNTYKKIAIGLPNLKTVSHIDALTIVVRQRVNIEEVPVTLTLPIYHNE